MLNVLKDSSVRVSEPIESTEAVFIVTYVRPNCSLRLTKERVLVRGYLRLMASTVPI